MVSDTSSTPSMARSSRTRSATPLRTSGSPPVRRTLEMPDSRATLTKKAMSSYDRISSCGLNSTPSGGMQYTQR